MQEPTLDRKGTLTFPDGALFLAPVIATAAKNNDELKCESCGEVSEATYSFDYAQYLCEQCFERFEEQTAKEQLPSKDELDEILDEGEH